MKIWQNGIIAALTFLVLVYVLQVPIVGLAVPLASLGVQASVILVGLVLVVLLVIIMVIFRKQKNPIQGVKVQ